MKLSMPVHQLKRQAKALQQRDGLRRFQALDRIAQGEGFRSWSHLASAASEAETPQSVHARLSPGEMILIGARPGQGKTMFALALAVEAMKVGRKAAFFTLEYTLEETGARLAQIGADVGVLAQSFTYDGSDEICADYVIASLADAAKPFIVIDYLQLLDQKRSKAPLAEQIDALSAFAHRSGATIACISQIDRQFAASGKAMPDINDLRLPNPANLSAFDLMCFLHDGHVDLVRR